MTNFEKFISELTPEKLAQVMIFGGKCPPIPENICDSMPNCRSCYEIWLTREAEDPL